MKSFIDMLEESSKLDTKYGGVIAEFGDYCVRGKKGAKTVDLFRKSGKGEQWQGTFDTIKDAQEYTEK